MCEGTCYTNLWDTKDAQRIEENEVFWVLFQSGLTIAINTRPRLSPTIYDKYKIIDAFQVTMHNFQIWGPKVSAWVSLPYMIAYEEIDWLVVQWPPHWKIDLKISAKGSEGTSTSKVTPPAIIKETGGLSKSTGKGTEAASQKVS